MSDEATFNASGSAEVQVEIDVEVEFEVFDVEADALQEAIERAIGEAVQEHVGQVAWFGPNRAEIVGIQVTTEVANEPEAPTIDESDFLSLDVS